MIKELLKNKLMEYNQEDFKFLKGFADEIFIEVESYTRDEITREYDFKNVVLKFKNDCDESIFGRIEVKEVKMIYNEDYSFKNLVIPTMKTYIQYYDDSNWLIECMI